MWERVSEKQSWVGERGDDAAMEQSIRSIQAAAERQAFNLTNRWGNGEKLTDAEMEVVAKHIEKCQWRQFAKDNAEALAKLN